MKTDDLIALLATQAGPVDTRAPLRRYGVAVACGALAAGALMISLIGVRDDLVSDAFTAMFWVKLGFVAALFAAALMATLRLSRPGAPLGRLAAMLAAPVLAMWALAAAVLVAAEPGNRAALVLGESWMTCPRSIATLSIPMFVAVLWGMKGLAPTRLRLAGAAAGVLAGAAGALAYTLACEELAAPFLGTWYVLGVLIPTAVGAAVGPHVLRW